MRRPKYTIFIFGHRVNYFLRILLLLYTWGMLGILGVCSGNVRIMLRVCSGQEYTYQVLQTIQMKLILLCVLTEHAVFNFDSSYARGMLGMLRACSGHTQFIIGGYSGHTRGILGAYLGIFRVNSGYTPGIFGEYSRYFL